ncbi:adenosylcobinamide-GDP ribazoletransferase [Litoreibacter sp.]|nr:adenosylcobinamide-GDP ribazoletransferase [Litoreibacter sp.]
MAKTDMRLPSSQTLLNDVLIAFALLTRLPVPHANFDDGTRPAAQAAWAYPIVGLGVGIIAALVGWLALSLALSPQITALLVLATLTFCTGAMHEDGLADCADGFWGGHTPERRLEIMKDSQIGAYGTIALIVTFALRWSALASLITAGSLFAPLLAAAVISRSAMAYVMDILPNARISGLSHMTGRPGKPATRITPAFAVIASIVTFGWSGLFLALIAIAIVIAISRLAKHKIGGQTGDVLGATQNLTETALLVVMTTLV